MKRVTDIIETFKRVGRTEPPIASTSDRPRLDWFLSQLAGSHKMLMPLGCDVGCDTKGVKDTSLVRLPYPVVTFVFESAVPGAVSEAVVLLESRVVVPFIREGFLHDSPLSGLYGPASEVLMEESSRVFFMLTMQQVKTAWTAPTVLFQVNLDKAFSEEGYVSYTPFILLEHYCLEHGYVLIADQNLRIEDNVTSAGTQMLTNVVSALACMNAKNINSISIPPSKVANQIRAHKHKVPLFEYHVLDIFLNPDVRKLARTEPNKARPLILDALTTSMPLHTVRGHFKQRKTGLFWWSPFIRGHIENGAVDKDYRVKLAHKE